MDNVEAARSAGLRYVSDAQPGISRSHGRFGFVYIKPGGRAVRAPAELRRIQKLAVPAAWTNVWISPDPRGHLPPAPTAHSA